MIIDNFAGGGGASTGIAAAMARQWGDFVTDAGSETVETPDLLQAGVAA